MKFYNRWKQEFSFFCEEESFTVKMEAEKVLLLFYLTYLHSHRTWLSSIYPCNVKSKSTLTLYIILHPNLNDSFDLLPIYLSKSTSDCNLLDR